MQKEAIFKTTKGNWTIVKNNKTGFVVTYGVMMAYRWLLLNLLNFSNKEQLENIHQDLVSTYSQALTLSSLKDTIEVILDDSNDVFDAGFECQKVIVYYKATNTKARKWFCVVYFNQ